LLKLDVKFDFPIYDGDLNAKKLDNWVKQIEVYCKVQKIVKGYFKDTIGYSSPERYNFDMVGESDTG